MTILLASIAVGTAALVAAARRCPLLRAIGCQVDQVSAAYRSAN